MQVEEVAAESIVHPPTLDTFQRRGTTQITSPALGRCKTLLPLYYRAININLQLLIVQIGSENKSGGINLNNCLLQKFLSRARAACVLHFVPWIIYTPNDERLRVQSNFLQRRAGRLQ
jgi:hypothetical protein